MNDAACALQWRKFPVLSSGFVALVDVMGDDSSVVQAARVSFGQDTRTLIQEYVDNPETYPGGREAFITEKERRKAKTAAEDRGLIRYLMANRHTTPFEMCEIKLLVRVPMDCWRQWIRHRTANVNEVSTRYTEAIDTKDVTAPDAWRLQSTDNKQGSAGVLTEWPAGWAAGEPGIYYTPAGPIDTNRCNIKTVGEHLSDREEMLHRVADEVYRERLEAGVAKEQARKDLPLSTYTEAYWKVDLHNLLHFLALRMDSHAQLEIRQYATIIGEQIVKPLFPVTWQAFLDYRMNGMQLSAMDVEAFRQLPETDLTESQALTAGVNAGMSKREAVAFVAKLRRLAVGIRYEELSQS